VPPTRKSGRSCATFDELGPSVRPSSAPRIGRPDYRLLISSGVLVRAIAVVGQLISGGSAELISITLDTRLD
jgi:hypothetical protein